MKYALAVLAVVVYFPSIAEGQLPAVAPGARIRVTVPGLALERQVTTVVDVRGDSITVATPRGPYTVGLADITALDISTGTRTQAARGAALGTAIGVASGAVVGALTYKECKPEGILGCFMAPDSRGSSAILGAALGGSAGLVIGAVAGALNRTDRWISLDLPVQLAVAPTLTGGVRVGLTRSF